MHIPRFGTLMDSGISLHNNLNMYTYPLNTECVHGNLSPPKFQTLRDYSPLSPRSNLGEQMCFQGVLIGGFHYVHISGGPDWRVPLCTYFRGS